MDLNVAVMVGRISAAPKPTAGEWIVLRLAVRRPARPGRAERRPTVDLLDVTLDGKLAASCVEQLDVGRRVVVAGRLEHRKPSGGSRADLHVVATMLQVLQ